MQLKPRAIFLATTFLGCVSTNAVAQQADASASLADIDGNSGNPGEDPFEIGVFGGGILLSHLDLAAGTVENNDVALEGGLRLGLFPLDYLGLELEGSGVLRGRPSEGSATIGVGRAHLIGQIPLGRVAPFAVVGGGFMGGECPAGDCSGQFGGRDLEGLFHFGVGAKVGLSDSLQVRLDVRDNIVNGDHLPDALLGLALTFGLGEEEQPAPPPALFDTDGDGKTDDVDRCPNEASDSPDGCPDPDPDHDGITKEDDKCPDVAGIAPDGCPDPDPDHDGIAKEDDKCPDVAGIAPDGCPDPDPDHDGIAKAADKCPEEPETKNDFEDTDGCPDEVPEKIKKFSGVIGGIQFDLGKATIRPASFPTLDEAVGTLKEYPALRVRVSGHTDSTGNDNRNLELSKARAQAVADYFVSKGIEASRIETVGEGSSRPIADNATLAGRTQNRRIEFQVIQ
jgi:outer membrane protein OmpA-like peptidoglycan-associated protein